MATSAAPRERSTPASAAASWAQGLGRVFARVLLFEVQGTTARSVAGQGIGARRTVSISLTSATPLRWALEAGSPIVGAGRSPGGSSIASVVGITPPRAFAVLPLLRGNSLVALVYADNAEQPLSTSRVAEVFSYCAKLLNGPERPATKDRMIVPPRGAVRSTARRPGHRGSRNPSLGRRNPEHSILDPLEPDLAAQVGAHLETPSGSGDDTLPDFPPRGLTLRLAPALAKEPEAEPTEVDLPFDVDALAMQVAFESAAPSAPSPRAGRNAPRPTPPPELQTETDLDLEIDVELPPAPRKIAPPPLPIRASPTPARTPAPTPAPPPAARSSGEAAWIASPKGAQDETEQGRPSRRHLGAWLGLGAALLAGIAAVAGLSPVRSNETEVVIEIPERASLSQIAEHLGEAHLIRSPTAFTGLARLLGSERHLRRGIYKLPTGLWAPEVLSELERGTVQMLSVTVPEGLTLHEVADLLEAHGVVSGSRFILEAKNPETLRALGVPAPSIEGFLFPETYTFARGLTPRQILEIMVHQLFTTLRDIPGAEALEDQALIDALTLASIVQREARVDAEMPRVAGVFKNRLGAGMKLESCATVQYLLGTPKARLTLEDIRVDSPYNTYLYPGLPPGPIANPGAEAIRAAVAPEAHDFLFFVAREDGSNRHIFTKTFDAHQAVQRSIQKRKRAEARAASAAVSTTGH